MGYKEIQKKSVGPELARLLPDGSIPFYRKKHLLRLNLSLFCLFLLSASDGYDGTLMNGLQALPHWQEFMGHPTGAWLGFVNAVTSLSAFISYPIVAWCNNKIGRKKTLGINYFWIVLAVALQTAANDPTTFVLGRFFIGASASFTSGSAPILITETAYPTHRGILTAVFNCGWHVGSLLGAWTIFGTRVIDNNWSWRIPSLLQCALPIIALVGFLTAPESPRWLASQDRLEEARVFLVKYHAGGDENSPLAEFELREIVNSLALEAQHRKSSSWLDMFRGRGNLHRSFITITLGVFAQWNGVGIVSYYLAPVLRSVGVTSVSNQTMISGFLQLWNLILSLFAAFNVDRFGRRPLFLVSCFGMLASYIVISGLAGSFANTGNSPTGIAVIPFLFIYYGFYDIAFTPFLMAYPCEIWQYNLRAKGLALGMNSSRLALFFNTFVNPIILDAIAWRYYIVYCVILVIITITIWFWYPETNGYTLEEMAVIFDGERADDKITSGGAEVGIDGKYAETDITHVEKA
ncbi:general substrate transporter [Aspergillus pseudoustus]|uniref:General substrate transporter n=1 Tax=Aspergillus pseudoustus TaxID=1810923 RepID=A0ABR4KJW0_9EURO